MNIKCKNLVIIHLESVNMDCWNKCKDRFKFLNKIKNQGTFYNNYYSSATSTYMVVSDLFYGEPIFESVKKISDIYNAHPQKLSIFDELDNAGYDTMLYFVGDISSEEPEGVFSSLNLSKKKLLDYDEECILNDFTNLCNRETKFAVFFENDKSHIAYINAQGDSEMATRNMERYDVIDIFVKKVFDILHDTNRLSETLVVIYGDHGDDYFSHGLHNGYLHAVEPYTFLVNCPLIVLGLNGKPEAKELLGTFDISKIIKNELCNNTCDIFNDAVISRNLFAAQKKQKITFNKSYAITNGKYTLISTSDGMQLYNNSLDYYNHFNLLNMFYVSKSGLRYNEKFDMLRGTHYHYLIADKSIKEIEDNYSFLVKRLNEELGNKYGPEWRLVYRGENMMNRFKKDVEIGLLLELKKIRHIFKDKIKTVFKGD